MESCCEQSENRETIEQRNDLTVQKCKACGRKHYEVVLDPIKVGVRL